jgi:hypothetical protein
MLRVLQVPLLPKLLLGRLSPVLGALLALLISPMRLLLKWRFSREPTSAMSMMMK